MLFWILIAVALLAALTYAFTHGTRSGGENISKEKIALQTTELLDYTGKIRQAVQMLLINGCDETEINFENNGVYTLANGTPVDYTNANSPVDLSCHVFKPEGGGLTPRLISADSTLDPSLIPPTNAHPHGIYFIVNRVVGVGTDTGAAGSDLLLFAGRATQASCIDINDRLGITNPGGSPPIDTYDCASLAFDGTFPNCANPIGDTVTALQGKQAFCSCFDSSTIYCHLKYILIAR